MFENRTDTFSTSTAIAFPGFFCEIQKWFSWKRDIGREVFQFHRILYPLEQVRQLVALQVAHPELLVEDPSPDELLLDAMAKDDIRRSTSESSHCGHETESA